MAGNLLRQSQVVTTFGPGSMLDLPRYSVIVTGLSIWTKAGRREIVEPRLIAKLQKKLDLPQLQLFSPPIQSDDPHSAFSAVGAQVFPTWFIVQDAKPSGPGGQWRRRRLVRWQDLDRGRFVDPDDRKKKTVVPVRFVCGCPRGHIDDLDWRAFVHGRGAECSRSMWLEERDTSGDIAETYAGCECRRERSLYEALGIDTFALGICGGKRPWLGPYAREECKNPQRLLVRTASNAYFPQLMSVISLPEQDEGFSAKIGAVWNILQAVQSPEMLQTFRAIPDVAAALDGLSDDEVMRAIERRRTGQGVSEERPVKQAEFDVLNSGHAHIGRDDSNSSFFAGTVLRSEWDPSAEPTLAPIEKLVLVHRLREVIALIGFTRFEAVNPNTDGELDLGVERAALDLEPTWLPAVEHKGEGIFISFRQDRITAWLQNEHVKARELKLMRGFDAWCKVHKDTHRVFPGLPYILLHSLSHLLLTAIALECGYPASSLRERVYASDGQYGILIYTGSSDSEGTLGGLIEAGRHIGRHLTYALDLARLCLYRTRFFAHKAALCGLVGCDRCGDPVPPCFGWASIAVLFQEPVPVVPTEVRPDDGADLLDVLEDASENELLLERADEPLDDAVGLRLADEGEAGRHPEEPQLVLEVLGHERAAVVLYSTSRFAVFSTLTRAPSIRY